MDDIPHSARRPDDGAVPDGRIFPVTDVRLVLRDDQHPWHRANVEAIEAHWHKVSVENPFYFNGTVIMHRGLSLQGGAIEGISHGVPFSMLLHFLATGPKEADVWHLFASSILVASDGALVLIRMSERTANPGRICAPAGSLDLSDIVDGRCNIDGNMTREVAEETGLDLGAARAEAALFGFRQERQITVYRRYHFAETSAVLAARIKAHIAKEADPEAADAVIVSSPAGITEALPPYMRAFIAFHFAEEPHRP